MSADTGRGPETDRPEETGSGEAAMEQLGRALEIHRLWLEEGGTEPAAEVLARHPEVADLLEPLLAEEGEPAPGEEPERLGEFQILREVGRGGMGVVYEAHQLSLRRRVALKVLPAHLTRQVTAVARFRREALTAAGLEHPGLVKVYAVGQQEQTHFFAMEFVDGAPLNRVVRELADGEPSAADGADLAGAITRHRHRPTPLEGVEPTPEAETRSWSQGYLRGVIDLVCQVAEALDHAHREGVIHRDVKPSNILVRRDGSAVLTDFGLARETGLTTMTLTGDFVGTPHYVSPEQAAGKGRETDHRSDIFSLGATLYELATFHRPFPGTTNQEVLNHIAGRDPVDPRRWNRALAPDLAAIILKALEKRPDRRYASAGAMAADLRAFLERRSVSARTPSAAVKVGRWVRREPLRAALVLVLATGVPALAWLGGSLAASRRLAALGEQVVVGQRLEEHMTQGFFYFGLDPERALASFERAGALDPGNREALLARATLLVDLGRHAAALDLLRRNSGRVRDSRHARALAAESAAMLGKTAPALPATGGDRRHWTGVEYFLEGIQAYEKAKRTTNVSGQQRAVDLLRKAALLSSRPRPLFWRELGRIAARVGAWEAAGEAAQVLQTHWPDRMGTRLIAAMALSGGRPSAAREAFARLEAEGVEQDHRYRSIKAFSLLRMGEHREAAAVLEGELPGLATAPRLAAENCYMLGLVHGAMRQRDAAIGWYRRSIELDGSRPSAHNNLGHQYRLRGDLARAESCFRKALELEPDYLFARDNLVLVLLRRRRHEEAVRHSRLCVQGEPENAYYRRHLVQALIRHGKRAEAEVFLRPLLGGSDRERARACLTMEELKRGEPAVARRWLHLALLADETLPQAHTNMAANLRQAKEYAAALPHLRRAVELRPGHWPVYRNLVSGLEAMGRHGEARRVLDDLVREYPRLWAGWNELARMDLDPRQPAAERQPRRAVARARRALDLAPASQHWRCHLTLAAAHLDAGEVAAARRALAAAEGAREKARLTRRNRGYYERTLRELRAALKAVDKK